MSDQATRDSLYRTIWRWHFYAGVLLAPVILIVSLTGFAYVFKRELETLIHRDVLLVADSGEEVSLDRLVETAESFAGEGWSARLAEIDVDPRRAFGVFLNGPNGDHQRLYVDQCSGEVLGAISDNSFFPIVLRLHRSLFAGSAGRIVTELTASWTIVLTLTGLFLWWPRGAKRNRATWFVLPRKYNYRTLRDLHAVGGLWLTPVLLVMATTGLLYTQYWGAGYGVIVQATGANEFLPESRSRAYVSTQTPASPWASTLASARRVAPGLMYSIEGRDLDEGRMTVYAGGLTGPSLTRGLAIDPVTGAIIEHAGFGDFKPLAQWSSWNYPLHVGSVLGLPSKLVWAAASIGLTLMPVTGVWMWLKRRPRGRLGVPTRGETSMPWGVVILAISLGCLLPLAGVSFLVAWLFDRLLGSRLTAR
ncbi:MAG: PepSY domain-containing protein [Planctomycetota bacterium]